MRFVSRCHVFEVHADRPEDAAAVAAALAPFRDDGARPATSYALRTTAPDEYSLFVDDRQVRVSSDPTEPLDLLFWYVGEATVEAEDRAFILHAGAVVAADGRALLLPGPSGSGKSTTTLGLIDAGFGYLSDEFAIVDPSHGTIHAFPRPLAIKEGSRALLPEVDRHAVLVPDHAGQTVHVPATRVSAAAPVEGPVPPGWVVFPTYVAGAATELTALSAGETCVELLRSTFRYESRAQLAMETMSALAASSRGLRMRTGDLGAAVRALTDLTTDDRADAATGS